MILGHSAATAACHAIDDNLAVQDVDYAKLRAQLDKDGQVLEIPAGSVRTPGISPDKLPGLVVDDTAAKKTGDWLVSSTIGGYVGIGYLHDDNAGQGTKSIAYSFTIEKPGTYDVRMSYSQNGNRATNVLVTIESAAGRTEHRVNQRRTPSIDKTFESVAIIEAKAGGQVTVTISNAGADGHVIADAVQLLPKE
ncbi:MAG: hypothetical protein R3B90_16345 [Planctomycetaceae bacterium]